MDTEPTPASPGTSSGRAEPAQPRRVLVAAAADAVAIVAFAAAGRRTHASGVFGDHGLGLATTAWPFLAGAVIGWFVLRAWRAPLAPLRTGLPVAVVAVAAGMLLRAASGQGTAMSFIVVATVTVTVSLVGWRAIARLFSQPRERLNPAAR